MKAVLSGVGVTLCLAVCVTAAAPSLRNEDDPRVQAFLQAYGELIDSVNFDEEDVVFSLGDRPIHFLDGRMLAEGRTDREGECDPIFYEYSLEPLAEPPPLPESVPTHCTDVLESLWGRTELEIRGHGSSVTFLDHRLFVNDLLIGPLAAVEREIRREGSRDPDVAEWIEELDITYSFAQRDIAGSPTRSHHAWGMAIDLVPKSYEGRAVYWRWSRVYNREGWHEIPVSRRWSPPQDVVSIFESHGFVWGGKWAHFDAIHFEYRPDILLYNQIIAQ